MNFKNSIIVFTSNLGQDQIMDENNKQTQYGKCMASIEKHFKPEFINRIDEFVVFNNLNKQSNSKINKLYRSY